MTRRQTRRSLPEPPPPPVEIRTPHEIVEELAATPHPDVARDPDESLAVLERLIDEARLFVRGGNGRRRVRTYAHEDPGFSRAMKLIDDAPGEELRLFAMEVTDLLWGEGVGTTRRDRRHLTFDKEWDSDTIEEVAHALSRYSLYPF